MIILLHGPDSYRRQKNLEKTRDSYLEKYGLVSADSFDLETEDGFSQFKNFFQQGNLFGAKKLGILKNISALNKEEAGQLKILLEEAIKSEEATLIISEAELTGDFQFLEEKAAKKFHYPELESGKMEFFIKKEAEERKINLAPETIRLMAKIFNKDTWSLITELEKMEFLESKIPITPAMLEQTISWFEEPEIFRYMDFVSKHANAAQKIPVLENLFLNKEESAKIFNIFTSRQYLDFETLKKLADCDVAIKSGKLDYELALIDMAL